MSEQRDEAKARFWQGMIREAARSGVSIREFCRRRKLEVAQFYWWRHRLKQGREPGTMDRPEAAGRARFALVSEEAGTTDAGIELVPVVNPIRAKGRSGAGRGEAKDRRESGRVGGDGVELCGNRPSVVN